MKQLKGIILALTGLFTVITLFSLLMPAKVMTVRSVVIHGTNTAVLSYIRDLRQWDKWQPVFMQDSAAIQFSNPSAKANAFAVWLSNGRKNRLQIDKVDSSQLTATLSREGEYPIENIIAVTALKDSNNVEAEWRVITTLKWYPWEKFSGIFIDKMTGPGYQQALDNLKQLVEEGRLINPGN